jgi:two-component system response regulator (stage 0 sporulation protein A)
MKDGKLDVLLVDDNIELCDIITEYINTVPDINISGVAHDGNEALQLIKEVKPDCIILDIIMPNLDGLEVLDKLHHIEVTPEPKTIILSIVHQDGFVQNAFEKGADYYLIKPVGLDTLEKKIREICMTEKESYYSKKLSEQANRGINAEEELNNILRIMGVPFSVKGFQYLKEAVLMVIESRNLLSSITIDLYPSIAEKYNTTPSRVERAIRHCIEITWLKGNLEQIELLFGSSTKYSKSRPTNGEVIAVLAEKLKLSLK